MNPTFSESLSVPLGREAHRYAGMFAAQQATPEKGKQVYLNTLAVYAVDSYLKWLSIPTSLARSDCWNPSLRATFNVADLVLPNVGKLECCPILPGQDTLVFSPELSPEDEDNRICYIGVRFREELDRVELLGFIPAAKVVSQPSISMPILELQSLDKLIDEIHRHQPVKLRQWFAGMFREEWQPVEGLLATNFRKLSNTQLQPVETSISRGKFINWKLDGKKQSIILTVKISEKSPEEIDIRLRFYPSIEMVRLPVGLVVTVLDEFGTLCMEAQTKDEDWLELDCTCQAEEIFSVCMSWEDRKIVERFFV